MAVTRAASQGELDAALLRAKAERWTEVALLGSVYDSGSDLIEAG